MDDEPTFIPQEGLAGLFANHDVQGRSGLNCSVPV